MLTTPENLEADLRQFTGTENWHRWSPLARRHVLTDGAKYLAEKAGAYWLMDLIASHHAALMRNKDDRLQTFQVWRIVRNDSWNYTGKHRNGCQVRCMADSDAVPAVWQKVEYTDFPLREFKLYVCLIAENTWAIMLPSEY